VVQTEHSCVDWSFVVLAISGTQGDELH